ncbi:hypothetical protein [Nocardioides sp. AE5]|uniref:hypothetical protein n=1 Tax=Nocardioides sp. AE5 TaxID=2962573 RepID=UPI002880DF06|nr:hypothetical protein [Nocardioides sp. AE5]MDT0202004.1 hypothetical protein [Nocardioides sp. AE5]
MNHPAFDAENPTRNHAQEALMENEDSGRHPVNTGHLVMGLAFAGLVAVWAVISSDLVAERDIRWLMPVPWVVAGAVGLAVAAWSGVRGKKHAPVAPAAPVADDTTESTMVIPTEEDAR